MPGKIDLVLDASIYAQILEDSIRRETNSVPIAQKIALEWILSGTVPVDQDHINLLSTENSINRLQWFLDHELLNMLQRFWNQEEVMPVNRFVYIGRSLVRRTLQDDAFSRYLRTICSAVILPTTCK